MTLSGEEGGVLSGGDGRPSFSLPPRSAPFLVLPTMATHQPWARKDNVGFLWLLVCFLRGGVRRVAGGWKLWNACEI